MSDTREREVVPTSELVEVPARRTFWLHAVLLLLALLALSTLLDNGYPAISDEGAVLAQLDRLQDRPLLDGDSWRIDRPFAELDPDATYLPLENSELSGSHYLPYAKHFFYPALLTPAYGLLGHHGAVVISAVAVWFAALAGAAISRRLGPSLPVVTLWILGLGSPLLFDSSVVMAHSLGAALLGVLVLCVLRHLERTAATPVTGTAAVGTAAVGTAAVGTAAVGAVLCAVALVLVRSEGMIAVAAVAAVLALMSVRSLRPPRVGMATLLPAIAIGVAGVAAYLVDGRVAAALLRTDTARRLAAPMVSASTVASASGIGDLISGRVSALWASVLRPASLGNGWGAPVVLVCCVLVVAGAVTLRFLPARRPLAVGLLVGGALLAVVRQFAATELISGLVPAFPILVAGLVFLRRDDLRRPVVRLCLGVSAISALGIWATSYTVGGGVEWGGRFYHLLLPLVVPIVVLGLDRARRGLPAGPRHIAVVSVLVVTASLSLLSLRAMHDMRRASEIVVPAALAAADAAAAPSDGGAPVLITDAQPLARSAWASLDGYRLLRVPDSADLEPLLDTLADEQVGTVTVLVSPLQELPDGSLGRWSVVEERELEGWNISYVELAQR